MKYALLLTILAAGSLHAATQTHLGALQEQVAALHHAAPAPIVEIDLRETGPDTYTFPPINLTLGDWAVPQSTYSGGAYSSSLDGVTFTSAGPFGGVGTPQNILGLKATGIDITFSLGSGANVITFDDIASGGGDVDVSYQTGNGPVREVTVAQGNGALNGGPSAVLFPKAVTNIFVSGSTSITGLDIVPVHENHHARGDVPMVPEPNPAPLLGAILLCGVVYEARRRLVKQI
jgi:hypothetical protein